MNLLRKSMYKDRGESTCKRVSAHLALRRDFFLPRVGFGVGFNASLALGDMLDLQQESKQYIDGKLQKPEKESVNTKDDDEEEGIYSITLMPMLYVAF